MKVLVVGGSGFIGTRLVATLLDRGHEVRVADLALPAERPELGVKVDVRDRDAVVAAAEGMDAIVNLAAAHRDDVRPLSLYAEVNVEGARNAVAAAEAHGIQRILFTSTVAVYPLDLPHPNEETAPAPYNQYGITKLAAEQVYRGWADADPARSLVIVRPSVVFGEGNRGNVWTLTRQLSTGRFVMVGRGDNVKAMSYVGNIVGFLADRLDAEPGVTLLNYADKPDLSTRELVAVLRGLLFGSPRPPRLRLPLWAAVGAGHAIDLVARVTRRSFAVSAIRMRKFAAETTVDTTRLEATGYRRSYTLPEALERTVSADFPEAVRGVNAQRTPAERS